MSTVTHQPVSTVHQPVNARTTTMRERLTFVTRLSLAFRFPAEAHILTCSFSFLPSFLASFFPNTSSKHRFEPCEDFDRGSKQSATHVHSRLSCAYLRPTVVTGTESVGSVAELRLPARSEHRELLNRGHSPGAPLTLQHASKQASRRADGLRDGRTDEWTGK